MGVVHHIVSMALNLVTIHAVTNRYTYVVDNSLTVIMPYQLCEQNTISVISWHCTHTLTPAHTCTHTRP